MEKENTGSNTWSGTAAAGGDVSVMVKNSTRFAHSPAKVEVTDWGWTTPRSLEEGDKLTEYLWPGVAFGRNANASGDARVGQVMGGDGAAIHTVASGPNEGYAIVNYMAYNVFRYRQLNERIVATGPEEIPDGSDTVRHWDYLKSRGFDPHKLFLGTFRHEGYGGFIAGRKGHQGQIEKALTVETCGDAGAITARIVAPTEEKAAALRDSTEAIADRAFIMATLHNNVYGNHGTGSPVAYWKPKNSPFTSLHRDRYNPDHERNYTSPGCDWQSF